jgi:HSP20 family protein
MSKNDDLMDLDELFTSLDEGEDTGGDTMVIEEEATVVETQDKNEITDDIPGQLAVDIYETTDHLVVKARTAGAKKSDLRLNIKEGVLEIHGVLPAENENTVVKWHSQECYWGEFSRTIVLPVPVQEKEAAAELRDGVLTVSFVKVKAEEPITIEVS